MDLGTGSKTAPHTPALIHVLDEPIDFRQELSDRVWSRIGLSKSIERIRDAVFAAPGFPEDAVAIHLRAGDIIYGHYANSPRWLNKVICTPMAAILARILHERGHTVILFGQESDTTCKLARRYGYLNAAEFYPIPPHSNVEAAFTDIFLISRCTSIFAGSSGFARIASQIRLATLQNPLSVLSRKEWPSRIHSEVDANPELYSPEQRAFAYLVCIDFCLKTGAVEALPEYARLARVHNRSNDMYALIEALIPLHMNNPRESNRLLETYYRGCERDSRGAFSRSAQIRVLRSSDGGSSSGLAFSRFVPKGSVSIDGTCYPYVAATLRFLDRPCSAESVESLRTDLLAAASMPA